MKQHGYAPVNGIEMYYEIHGSGRPIVLIHGGGSTLDSSFGRIIPELSASRQVIAMDMQAHGRTADRDTALSFEQDAADIEALLKFLEIDRADFLGFSNGAQTLTALALKNPSIIRKMILASTFLNRDTVPPGFWDGFDQVTLDAMPRALQDAFLEVNNDPAALQNMFNRDVERMAHFIGWPDEKVRTIEIPCLVITGNYDVVPIEVAVRIYRTLPNAQLAVFPGGHGTYIGTLESIKGKELPKANALGVIAAFLDEEAG